MPGWWDQQTKANLDHQPCGMERGKKGQEQEAELERHPGILTLILIWVGNHFFPHHQAILRTPAGYWLRTLYNLTQF